MSRLRAQDPIRVPLGDCECPGKPHSEDAAFLPPSLSPEQGTEGMALVYSGEESEVIQRKLARVFLARMTWNLEDEDGPVDPATVWDRYDWATASPIVNAAAEMYTTELMAPFRSPRPKSSPHGQTEASTSANPASTSESP